MTKKLLKNSSCVVTGPQRRRHRTEGTPPSPFSPCLASEAFSTISKGFTLIETLLYLALYAILMTGVFVAIFAIVGSQERDSTSAMLEEEGNFLLGKIEYTLSDAQTIDRPGDSGPQLIVASAYGGISIWSGGGAMQIQQDGGHASVLNNEHTTVSDLLFIHDDTNGLESVQVSFTLHATTSDGRPVSRDFSAVHYFDP